MKLSLTINCFPYDKGHYADGANNTAYDKGAD
jgi:hypothetical protein